MPDPDTRLSHSEKSKVLTIYALIVAATAGGFIISSGAAEQYTLLLGLGVMSYVLGLRHGLDADHIAAIDTTSRKLLQDGRHPFAVGTWVSLGHSTVVFGLIVALTVATRAGTGFMPALQTAGSVVGGLVSGTFLFVMGVVNIIILFDVYRTFRALRTGAPDQADLADNISTGGFMNRAFGRLFSVVRAPWQIYPIGVLFGLGFDTASEVAMMAIIVGVGASSTLPLWAVLTLPLMFACGMVLVDTSDGVLMVSAYGWAFLKPVRKIYYNLTVSIISVMVAFLIGGVELLQVMAGALNMNGAVWDVIRNLSFESLGGAVVAVFAATWLVSISFYRHKGYDRGTIEIPSTRAE